MRRQRPHGPLAAVRRAIVEPDLWCPATRSRNTKANPPTCPAVLPTTHNDSKKHITQDVFNREEKNVYLFVELRVHCQGAIVCIPQRLFVCGSRRE